MTLSHSTWNHQLWKGELLVRNQQVLPAGVLLCILNARECAMPWLDFGCRRRGDSSIRKMYMYIPESLVLVVIDAYWKLHSTPVHIQTHDFGNRVERFLSDFHSMLLDASNFIKTKIVLNYAKWTYISITFRNCSLFIVFSRLKTSP